MAVSNIPFKLRFPLIVGAGLLISTGTTADASGSDGRWRCFPDSSKNWVCEPLGASPGQAVPNTPIGATASPATSSAAQTASAQSPQLRLNLDWVPVAQLNEEQREGLPASCGGRYIEPERVGKDFKGDINQAPIHAESDTSDYKAGEKATFTGNVIVRQGYREVRSDKARLFEQTEMGEFEGNVIMREPNLLVVSDKTRLQTQSGRMDAEGVNFAMHDAHSRGQAQQFVRREDGIIEMTDASYTTCAPNDNSWVLTGSEVSISDETGFGSATHAVLRVKDVPVFYTPYIHFPIDDRRQSGFLYPELGYSSESGTDIIAPYYLNLAPNYDATITPRLQTKRGVSLESEFRYLTESSEGEIGGSFLPSDNLKDENRNYDENRWLVNLEHEHQITSRWDATLDFANASDKDYLQDFGTSLEVESTDNLNQQFETRYRGGDDDLYWSLLANAQAFKNMRQDKDDPYEKLPQIEFQGGWNANQQLSFSWLADATYFTRDDDWKYIGKVPEANRNSFDQRYDVERSIYEEGTDEITNANGTRVYLETGSSYRWQWPFAYIEPTVKAKTLHYKLSNLDRAAFDDPNTNPGGRKYDTSPSTSTPMFSLDSGLYFDRASSYFGSSFTHTLEPRLFYLYVPEQDDQEQNPLFDTGEYNFSYDSLWREDRFSGRDRLADANQVSLGITTRLLNDSGFETLRFAIGQTYYFEDREVLVDPYYGKDQSEDGADSNLSQGREWTLDEAEASSSPIASELVWNFSRASSIRQEWVYNTDQSWNQDYLFAYRYNPDPARMLDVAYRYEKRPDRTVKDDDGNAIAGQFDDGSISQSDISAIWPIYGNWSFLGRWNHDLTNNESLEVMAGTEYDSCCYKVRFLFRQSLSGSTDDIENANTENAFVLQFVLKGLGGFGTNTRFLEGIKGYEEYDKSSGVK
ncbi:LPS assembly protein LptD [Aestuariirhabdus sp. Z084]|uniref:LPS-assembly protein LptD n=1 Tax=Aestuariirhabdus haliotis TaxID=2918751 RepID=UPI00201B3CDF|nr:LPS assembly protein LptD [Aestuariirhabdus haliotis]MCL6415408.1 LPS assembly protein LptD [Aestuariirhabdus haliotis]MCL6419164.1 LPS assembly protein LptD [Aestuariirhabdus haliotis]